MIKLLENLPSLRPQKVQQLLESCTSIKATRLFLYAADTAGHAWQQHVDTAYLDLGKGRRHIVKEGHVNKKYNIKVPGRDEEKYGEF